MSSLRNIIGIYYLVPSFYFQFRKTVSLFFRFTCHECLGTRTSGCKCVAPENLRTSDLHKTKPGESKARTRRKTPRKHRGVHNHVCDICSKMFCTPRHLADHKNTHTGDKPYVCDSCGRSYAKYRSFYAHRLTHTSEKSYTCETCGKNIDSLYHFKAHIRIHTREKPYVCEICGKTFTDNSALWYHKKVIHSEGITRFKCNHCPLTFFKKSALSLHLTTHMDKRPYYACNVCQKTFTTDGKRKRHEFEAHSTEKPYQCNYCNSVFKRQSHLKVHCSSVHKAILMNF